ncbi:MAG: putative ABC transporter permease [Oscillospiraceae bacterium]|nr:putative ABC transporter permease [Oscillospiraceae bacterium]
MNTLPNKIKLPDQTDNECVAEINPPEQKKSVVFIVGLNLYKLFWIFLVGSFLGVLVETMFCILKHGYYQSRVGLVWGPFNAVYGFGAVLIILVVSKIKCKNYVCIFLGSMIIGGSFEYLCSLFQELIFGTVSWEYSNTPINIAGRTNLFYSFFWGILGLFFVRDIMPRLNKILEKISGQFAFVLTWVMIVFMTANIAVSFLAVERWQQRRNDIPSYNIVYAYVDKIFTDEYLQKKYPNMTIVDKSYNSN